MYIACYKGHDKVVQVLLDHGAKADVPDKVSNISCIHVKLCNTTEINEATLSQRKLTKKCLCIAICSAIDAVMVYSYRTQLFY